MKVPLVQATRRAIGSAVLIGTSTFWYLTAAPAALATGEAKIPSDPDTREAWQASLKQLLTDFVEECRTKGAGIATRVPSEPLATQPWPRKSDLMDQSFTECLGRLLNKHQAYKELDKVWQEDVKRRANAIAAAMDQIRLEAQRLYGDPKFLPKGDWHEGYNRQSDHMDGILRGPPVPTEEPRRSIYLEWRRRSRLESYYERALRKLRDKARDDYDLPH